MLQSTPRNSLLLSLAPEDLAYIGAYLEAVDMPLGYQIAEMNRPVLHCYFIEQGIASMVAVYPGGKMAEAGLIGREGITPVSPVMSVIDNLPYEFMMQVPGCGLILEATALEQVCSARPDVHRRLVRFACTLMEQTAYTALSNAVHKVDTRLARWILMCHDRIEGDELALTHEYMAVMLGIRRPSVTDAIHILEGERLIFAERGLVIVRDRARLEAFAGEAYGPVERNGCAPT